MGFSRNNLVFGLSAVAAGIMVFRFASDLLSQNEPLVRRSAFKTTVKSILPFYLFRGNNEGTDVDALSVADDGTSPMTVTKANGGFHLVAEVIAVQVSVLSAEHGDNCYIHIKGSTRDVCSTSSFLHVLAQKSAASVIPRLDALKKIKEFITPTKWSIIESTKTRPSICRWNREVAVAPGDELYIVRNGKAVKIEKTPQPDILKYPHVVQMINEQL